MVVPLFVAVAAVAFSACVDHAQQLRRAEIYYDLGVSHLQNQRFREAMAQFETALNEYPEYARAHAALALIYHSMGDLARAEASYKKAIEYDPKFTDAYNNLGSVYIDMDRCDEAIPLFQKATADLFYNTPYLAEHNLGWCYYKTGRTDLAIHHIRKALTINPKFCLAYRNLGTIYEDEKKCVPALDQYRKYAEYCPDEQLAHLQTGMMEAACGDVQNAVQSFAKCSDLDPKSETGLKCRGKRSWG